MSGALQSADTARPPVLLELFTSEGCSSCPPADQLLAKYDQNADLIVLSEHVDYWNYLGWRDRFSSAQFSERQQIYTGKYKMDGVYTPQLVVDGRYSFVGNDKQAADAAIAKAQKAPKLPVAISAISRTANRVTANVRIEPHSGPQATVYVALADTAASSKVSAGENSGHSLNHVAVVRVLKEAGKLTTGTAFSKDIAMSLPADSKAGGSRFVAFIQDDATGQILGVAQQKF